MIYYWGKQLVSEKIGRRAVDVECNKCGCNYCFVMTRIGSGTSSAPYGIGVGRATLSAEKKAQSDLTRQLERGTELVPCPKCNWINEDLVLGYRRGRFRQVGALGIALGFVGTIVSLLIAWIMWMGPRADRAALPYLLIGGPVVSILLCAMFLMLQYWLRALIRPNRDFPRAPKLPAGTPPAVLEDPTSGELTPHDPGNQSDAAPSVWQEFQIGRDHLPLLCCGCQSPATPERGYKCQLTSTIELRVPRCEDCVWKARRRGLLIWFNTTAIGLLIAFAVTLPLHMRTEDFWIIIGVSFGILVAVAAIVASVTTAPVKVAGRDPARGVVKLRFRNPEYRQAVAAHLNDVKMTNI